MATIHNSSLMAEIRDVIKLQVGRDVIPNNLTKDVVPVIDVNPKHARVINKPVARTAAGTIYVCPAGKKVFIYAIHVSVSKTGADTGTVLYVTGTIDGATISLVACNYTTLVAKDENLSFNFPIPIVVDESATLTLALTGTFTVSRVTLFMCEVDSKA